MKFELSIIAGEDFQPGDHLELGNDGKYYKGLKSGLKVVTQAVKAGDKIKVVVGE